MSDHNNHVSFIVLHSLVRQVFRSSKKRIFYSNKKYFKIPNKWLERLIDSLPCGNSTSVMSTTCENNNSEMDAFSLSNYRKDSTHCFYQNRGENKVNKMRCLIGSLIQELIFALFSHSAAIDR